MKIGFYSWYNVHNNNKLLSDFSTSEFGGDNTNYPLALLVQKLKEQGHEVSTIDTDDLDSYDKIVFFEFPEFMLTGCPNKYLHQLLRKGFSEMYLVCAETPAVKPNNFNVDKHRCFKKIFTWHDELVDNKRYFRIHSTSHKKADRVKFDLKDKIKLCALIGRQKFSEHPRELYSERVRAIRWFEKNHPGDFDLYGGGWDEYRFKGSFKCLNLIDCVFRKAGRGFPNGSYARRLFYDMAVFNKLVYKLRYGNNALYPSYKGKVKSIRDTLKKYKFVICFENSGFPGWITERIFDCFLSGCVPVYLGDTNITDRLPKETFIDMREYSSYAEIYSYMRSLTVEEYLRYIEEIKRFISSEKNYPFTAEYFAETLLREIFR